MNSKERVTAVINGKIPDKVPLGEFAVDSDTAEKIIGHETYHRAKAKSQIAFWEGRRDEVIQSWKEDYIELHKKLGILDIVTFSDATWMVPMETAEAPERISEDTWKDREGRIYRFSDITEDITCIEDPTLWSKQFLPDDFSGPVPPIDMDPISLEIRDHIIDALADEKYICTPCGGEVGITFLGGIERGCMELITNPEAVNAATQYALRTQAVHDEIMIHPKGDGVLLGQDFSATTGPFISPKMFREMFFSAIQQRVQHLHDKYGIKVLKHACGNNWELFDMFIEIGYDAYQSIQSSASMDIRKLKAEYGDKITLWGGVSLENLVSGTAEEVRQDVRYAMEYGKPGGRFILGASHSIAVGTNYDNYMAMLDEYSKLASY